MSNFPNRPGPRTTLPYPRDVNEKGQCDCRVHCTAWFKTLPAWFKTLPHELSSHCIKLRLRPVSLVNSTCQPEGRSFESSLRSGLFCVLPLATPATTADVGFVDAPTSLSVLVSALDSALFSAFFACLTRSLLHKDKPSGMTVVLSQSLHID